MVNHNLKYREITGKIIGSAMKVHRYFGPGFPEIVYHRSLIIELEKLNYIVDSEIEKIITYRNVAVGKRRIDLIIDGTVLVELKAISELDNAATNQVLNCLKVFGLEIGLLLNFGKTSLEYKRFIIDLDEGDIAHI
jgi:GxxExxY protein